MKTWIIGIGVLIMGLVLFLFNTGLDSNYQEKALEKVTIYIYENYEKDEVIEIKPAYDSKQRDKAKRHQIAVKFVDAPDEYMTYIFKEGKVVELGSFQGIIR